VVPVTLPALRERRSDIPMLARHFIDKYNKKLNKKIEGIADDALSVLQSYPWPGNIRELENLMERTMLFCEGPQIDARDLPPELTQLSNLGTTVAMSGSAARQTPASTPATETVVYGCGCRPFRPTRKAAWKIWNARCVSSVATTSVTRPRLR
jgi:DNA-binding NtrC family response regulator